MLKKAETFIAFTVFGYPPILIALELMTYQCLGFAATSAKELKTKITSLKKVPLEESEVIIVQQKKQTNDPRKDIIQSGKDLIKVLEHLEKAFGMFLIVEIVTYVCYIIFSLFFCVNLVTAFSSNGNLKVGLFLFGCQSFVQVLSGVIRIKVSTFYTRIK